MTMVNEAFPIKWKELYSAQFDCPVTFDVALAENEMFHAEEVLRVVPKRRVVAAGFWRGKSVVAKIFFDPKQAKRHMKKETAGYHKLMENKIPTPPLLYYGGTTDKRIYILIFQRIFNAKSLQEIWVGRESIQAVQHKIQAVIIELATQHVLGILQHDLHLKNFLLTRKIIYTLDGAQIEFFPDKINKQDSMEHLALFLSQLGIGLEIFQKQLFQHYATARGWLIKDSDYVELFFLIKKWNESRWMNLSKKIFRDSSEFVYKKNWSVFCVHKRNFAGTEFHAFLKNPELAFNHPTSQILKAGRTSTVVKVVLDAQALVVKRYNLKSFWHRLRRTFRTTRAAACWRLAHKLMLFGVTTAPPIAFIERRFFSCRGKAYYVTQFVPGGECRDLLVVGDKQQGLLINRIAVLLQNLAKLTITHGDLKLSNILINEHCHPLLIDLDGAREHASLSSLRAAWRKEIKRFLKNFDEKSALHEEFKLQLESD